MRASVSIPDWLFAAADRHARDTARSRSQLYAAALEEYLARHAPDEVTEAVNAVVDRLCEPIDPFILAASRRAFERDESW
jgi:metal-responsive CopG/Arc/MetJ family transcriptional regulator